jgi:large subunit ribosomal protein L18
MRRRREGSTNYRQRLRLLKSGLPRMVVRKTSRNFIVQFVEYRHEGDRIIASAEARELPGLGWKYSTSNLPAAYLTGLLAGKRAGASGTTRCVLDIGLNIPSRGSKIFAALKGSLDSGIEIPHDDSILPSEDRISGGHVAAQMDKPDITKDFENVKKAIEDKEVAP